MPGRLSPFLAALLVALLALPALADAAPQDDRAARRAEETARWQSLNATQQAAGLASAKALGLFEGFTYTAGSTPSGAATVSGKFLKFSLGPTTQRVTGLQVRADGSLLSLFSKAIPDRVQTVGTPFVGGPSLMVTGNLLDLFASNDPLASLTWRAASKINLTFVPASGIKPTLPDKHEALIPIGSRHVHLASDGAGSMKLLSNGTLTVPLALNESVTLRLHPAAGADWLHDLVAAFKTHHVGAVLRLADAGNGKALVAGDTSDVRVNTTELAASHASWTLSSVQHASRLLFLTLPNGTLDLARLDAAVVTLNGTVVPHVATSAKVVGAKDAAVAFVPDADRRAVTMVVEVPRFSTSASASTLALLQPAAPAPPPPTTTPTVTVTVTRPQRSTPAPMAGEAAMVLLTLAALARRRA